MYILKGGIVTDRFCQYECNNISQVKNTINEITKTNSKTADWKELCYELKKDKYGEYGCSTSIDYLYFDENGNDNDCSVSIGYDENTRTYLVWVECD